MKQNFCIANGCFWKGKIYGNGDSFRNDCNRCHCNGGRVLCTFIECDMPDVEIITTKPLNTDKIEGKEYFWFITRLI